MKDLLTIIIIERHTLLRGLLISFLLVLPFTFLPIIVKHGLLPEAILYRLPDSILYAFGFSLLVVFASFIQNYNNLVYRKRIYNKPAFKKLDFYGRLDGFGSVVNELETFLLGKIGAYFFRLNIIDPNLREFKIEIVPFIDLSENEELKRKLKKEFSFTQSNFFGQIIKLTEIELEDENFLLDKLIDLEKTLSSLEIIPIQIDEIELQ